MARLFLTFLLLTLSGVSSADILGDAFPMYESSQKIDSSEVPSDLGQGNFALSLINSEQKGIKREGLYYLQALYVTYEDTNDERYLWEFARGALKWMDNVNLDTRLPNQGDFYWSDHAAGIRAAYVGWLLQFATLNNGDSALIAGLTKHANSHVTYLTNPRYFTTGNHGLIQAYGLATLCILNSGLEACAAREIVYTKISRRFVPGSTQIHAQSFEQFRSANTDPDKTIYVTDTAATAPSPLDYAYSRFEEVLDLVLDPADSLTLEHTPGYHLFAVLRLVQIEKAGYFAQGLSFGESGLRNKIKDALNSIAHFYNPKGKLSRFGNTAGENSIENLLPNAVGYGASELSDATAHLKAQLTNSPYNLDNLEVSPSSTLSDGVIQFNNAGYVVFRTPWSNTPEQSDYLVFNGAFHSMVHKHQDDFSIEWFAKGRQILVEAGRVIDDPSTIQPTPPALLSTPEHNTLIIDGKSYPTLPTDGYSLYDREWNVLPFDIETDLAYGSAIDYSGETNGIKFAKARVKREHLGNTTSGGRTNVVIEQERYLFSKPGEWLVVADLTTDDGGYDLEQRFHLHPDLTIASGTPPANDAYSISSTESPETTILNVYPLSSGVQGGSGESKRNYGTGSNPILRSNKFLSFSTGDAIRDETNEFMTLFSLNPQDGFNVAAATLVDNKLIACWEYDGSTSLDGFIFDLATKTLESCPTSTVSISNLTVSEPSNANGFFQINVNTVASGGSGAYEYQYGIFDPTQPHLGWEVIGDWSTTANRNLFVAKGGGSYVVRVEVRDTGVYAAFGGDYSEQPITFTPPAQASNISVLSSPVPAGSSFTFNVTSGAVGGSGQYEYLYKVSRTSNYSGGWDTVSDWGDSPSRQITVQRPSGTHHVMVYVRNKGSNVAYDDYIITTVVFPTEANAVGVNVVNTPVLISGAYEFDVSASASEGTGDYEYLYKVSRTSSYSGGWDTVSNWGSNPNRHLRIQKPAGTYHVMVYVRNKGSNATYEDYIITPVVFPSDVNADSVTVTSVTANGNGTYSLNVDASASGGSGNYEYLYKVSKTSSYSGGWDTISGWGVSSGRTLTVQRSAGTYHVMVYVRNNGSNVSYDDYKIVPVTLP